MEIYDKQNEIQIPLVLEKLRWRGQVANDLLVLIDNLQLYSGFVRPIFNCMDLPIHYLEKGFVSALRERMRVIDMAFWIEECWKPPLQREGDASIMEEFVKIQGISKADLEKANLVRIYLRVITISDLVHPNGKFVPDNMLDGTWQSGSDSKWPYQPKPAKHYWTAFRNCLKKTFCTKAPTNQRTSYSLELD